MKLTTKYSLLLVGLIILTQTSKAQDDRDFRIGFKITPGFDWVKSKTPNVLKDGLGIGFTFGLMADIKIADNYFFTPELLVTSMSNRMKLTDTNNVFLLDKNNSELYYNNISHKYNLKYLETPLTFKFRTNESGGMRFWGQVGIAPGLLIGHNATTAATAAKTNTTAFPISDKYQSNTRDNDKFDFYDREEDGTQFKVTDDINVLRLSMILGAGIEYNLSGNTSLYLGVRFNNGFTDMLDDKKSKMINNVLGIEIGAFF